MLDEKYMGIALKAAEFAKGRTSPNPPVGACIVKDGRVVGLGWHQKAGMPHAEINALNMAGENAKGATVYVTLEPCAHQGRTGPCAEALVKAGVSRVCMAMIDPNPLVAGKGIEILRKGGVDVTVGVRENEARQLMEVFLKWMVTGRPFTVLKTAMSLDGKIAAANGMSKWITSEESRLFGHKLRDEYDAIMVGVNTVIADDPSLTTRLKTNAKAALSGGQWIAAALADKNISPSGKNPCRIIVDSLGRTPLTAKVITDGEASTIIAVTVVTPKERIEKLREAGAEVVIVPADSEGRVNLAALLDLLGKREKGKEITSILVEGGATLAFSLLKAQLIDKVEAFIAPKFLGGEKAKSAVGGEGFSDLNTCPTLHDTQTEFIGSDIHITGYLNSVQS